MNAYNRPTSGSARTAGHYVGSPVPALRPQGSRFPYPCVCVPARQHQRLTLVRLRIVCLHLCASITCLVPSTQSALSGA